MRKVFTVLCLLPFGTLAACSSHVQRQVEYDTYVQAKMQIAEAQAKAPPVLEFKGTDSGGKELHIVVNLPQQMPDIQQIKPREDLQFWSTVLAGTIPVVGTIATTWVSSHYNWKNNEAMWGAIGNSFGSGITVGGDATITGSGNRADFTANGQSTISATDFMNAPSAAGEAMQNNHGFLNNVPAPEEAPMEEPAAPVTPAPDPAPAP